MLRCWEENPVDRPTFDKLRKTIKEMEINHKVSGLQRRLFGEPQTYDELLESNHTSWQKIM